MFVIPVELLPAKVVVDTDVTIGAICPTEFAVIAMYVANAQAVVKDVGKVTVKAPATVLPVIPHCKVNPLDNFTYPFVDNDLAISTKALPLNAGNETIVEPATAGADSVTVPLVSPERTIEAIIYPYLKIALYIHATSKTELETAL